MKNRKKLVKGVFALSMALSFGTAILAPTHEAVASGGGELSIFELCYIPAGAYHCYPCFLGPRQGGQCIKTTGNCWYSPCG
jgi:hypothetical protein